MTLDPGTERKPIDTALRSYLDAAVSSVSALSQPTDEERAQVGRGLMIRALKSRTSISGLPNRVATRDVVISGELTGRLYTASNATELSSVLIYLHGGGWVFGSIETHDPFCRLLSEAAGISILSVGYRLAPENPFPAALDDTLTAFQWAASNARDLGGDPQRLLLGGDSAGGNLAAVAAHRICAGAEEVKPAALVLLYPVTDHPSSTHASYTENGTGYGLDVKMIHWFWAQYASHIPPSNPEISPLRLEELPPLPPTLVATAEYDPLRDEGIAYAEMLGAAGVNVTHMHAPDMHHNFPVHPGTVARFPQSITAIDQFAGWLKRTLKGD